MRVALGRFARRLITASGYVVSRADAVPRDLDSQTAETVRAVRSYTLTTPARIDALCQAVRYVVGNRIPGAVVECGVWRGGSMMAAARTLLEQGEDTRQLYLFDTFEGMERPGPQDRFRDGVPALEIWERESAEAPWCYAPMDEVLAALRSTGYPEESVHCVAGRVEDTLPAQAPQAIAILRLDTDWYESTRHELETLYPRLVPGGVLIIDDYGYWQGARQAVDEFFATLAPKPLLTRIDDSGRLAVVPGAIAHPGTAP